MEFCASLAFNDPVQAPELARVADESGWNALAIPDHVIHPERLETPYPYTEDGQPRWELGAPWPDPWVLISAMAAVTRRLRFYTSIYILPLRNPFAVAKAVGTAAVLSGGRVGLGIGMGWMKEEFAVMGQDFRRRGKRADEMIEVLRKLWAGGMVEHRGEFYDFDRLQMDPVPPSPIPIYVGGISEPALRRVGRLADGWISDIHTVDELSEIIGRIRMYREEYGRARAPLEVYGAASDVFDLDGYKRMQDAGVTHVCTMPWAFYTGKSESFEDKRAGLLRFADDVIAKF